MIKRLLLGVSVLFLCTSGAVHAAAVKAQKEPSAWAKAGVTQAIASGIVPANLQGNYQAAITREEFASLFVQTVFAWQERAYGAKGNGSAADRITRQQFLNSVTVKDFQFTDTKSEDIKLAYALGFVNGTSKTAFSPKKAITRQEAAVMLVNYFRTSLDRNFSTDEIEDIAYAAGWAKDYLLLTFHNKLFTGTKPAVYDELGGLLKRAAVDPLGKFTREQAILVAFRTFNERNVDLRIRGLIPFTKAATEYRFEITRDSIKLIGAQSAQVNAKYYEASSANIEWDPASVIEEDTKRSIAADKSMLFSGFVNEELYVVASKGKNAKYDLGWATFEILNPDYLFLYEIKPDAGVYNFNYYGGSEHKVATFIKIE